MKAVISLLLFTIIVLVAQPDTVEFEIFSAETTYHILGVETNPSISIDLSYRYPKAYRDYEVLKNLRITFAEAFGLGMQEPPETALWTVVEDMIADYTEIADILDEMEFIESLNHEFVWITNAVYQGHGVLACFIEKYEYSGGAHGNDWRNYLVIDLTNGHPVSIDDVFIEGYEGAMTDLITKQLLSKHADEFPDATLEEIGYWEDDIAPNDNFFVTSDGLAYHFNSYEIAPYSAGHTVVVIPWEEISGLIDQEGAFKAFIK